jgi:hypothetical protein
MEANSEKEPIGVTGQINCLQMQTVGTSIKTFYGLD